jgi:hypothetical protein
MSRLSSIVMIGVRDIVLSFVIASTGRVGRMIMLICHTGRKLRGIARSRSVFGIYAVSAWLGVGVVFSWWATVFCAAMRSFLAGVFVRWRIRWSSARVRLVSVVIGSSSGRYGS